MKTINIGDCKDVKGKVVATIDGHTLESAIGMKNIWADLWTEESYKVDEARTIARKLYAENKRLKEMNTDMLSDIQEHCASCGLCGSDCTGCQFQHYDKRSR